MIVRLPNELRDSYTVISDELLADPVVSTEALGVYCYLLSKPPNWVIRAKQIANTFDGNNDIKVRRRGIENRLKELETAGYVERRKVGKRGVVTTTILYESKQQTITDEELRESGNSILKLSRSDRNKYTKFDNSVFREPALSLRALGALCHCLTNKNQWNFNRKYLRSALKKKGKRSMGKRVAGSILEELIENNYAEKVATGNKVIQFNQDYVMFESSSEILNLTPEEKDHIRANGIVDINNIRSDSDLINLKNDIKNSEDGGQQDVLSQDARSLSAERATTLITNINTKLVNTKTTPYHPLLKSSPTAKKTLAGAGENSKQNSKQNSKDNSTESSQNNSQEKLSHVKQNSESDESRDLTGLTKNRAEEARIRKALRELSFPKPFNTKDRTIKILLALSRANVNDEPILREELYECIQSKINDIAVLARDKSSGIEWEKGIPILIRSQVKEEAPRFLMTENIFDEKIAEAATDKADSYQKMLDSWDELCKSSSKHVAIHSPNILLDDHAVAVAIFSNSEESRAKMHPQRSDCLSEHYEVTTYLTDLKSTFEGLKDKVTKEALEILAERKGITDLVSYLEQLSIDDFDYLLEDTVHSNVQVN